MSTLADVVGGTTLQETVVHFLAADADKAPLIEVGVGPHQFIGIVDYDVQPSDPLLHLEQDSGKPVIVAFDSITYVRIVYLSGPGGWPKAGAGS